MHQQIMNKELWRIKMFILGLIATMIFILGLVLFFDIMRILGPVLLIATLIFLLFILDYIF